MRKVINATLILGLVFALSATAGAFDMAGKLGVGIDGGLMIPAAGDVSGDSTISDYFDLGPIFGAHIKYGVTKEFALNAGFKYSFMKIKDDANDDPTSEPYLTMPKIYLDGILNLGALMNKPGNIWNPFVKVGGGMYMWKFTDDGAGGDAVVLDNLEEFKKTSFGLDFGAGLEVFATPNMSVFVAGEYDMIFSEDTDKFGEIFGNMGVIDASVGLTYYFPLQGQ